MLVYVYVYHTLEEPGVDEVLVTTQSQLSY